MSDTPQDYITVEEAAAILGITTRQVNRYQDRVRTERVGNRILYNRDDIFEQAALRGRIEEARQAAEDFREQRPPKIDVIPTGEMLDYLRERDETIKDKDQQIERLNQQLIQAAHRIGELEAQLKYQKRPAWWRRLLPPPAGQDKTSQEGETRQGDDTS